MRGLGQIVAGVLVMLGLVASSASAETPRQIADSAVVVNAPCPMNSAWIACAVPEQRVIYAEPLDRSIRKAVMQHERGHIFFFYAPEDVRQEAMYLLGYERWREERAADGYAACRLSRRERELAAKNGRSVGQRTPALCHLIRYQ